MVKSILFRVKASGQGIVNFDDQKNQEELLDFIKHLKIPNNPKAFGKLQNYSVAKRNFNGDGTYKIKISSDCITNSIFKDEIEITKSIIATDDTLFVPYVASPSVILRGYVMTENMTNRKSAVQLNDFVQSNDALSTYNIGTTMGEKDNKSMINKESIGEIAYESTHCKIDLKELQFCSLTPLHGRQMFNADLFDKFKRILKNKIPSFDSKVGYYVSSQSSVRIPEHGFVFNNETINFLVKFYFKNLLKVYIQRKKAFAQVDTIEYKLCSDPLSDRYNDTEGWVEIKTGNDIDNISFETEIFYDEMSEEESLVILNKFNETKEAKKEAKEAKKTTKKVSNPIKE